MRTWIAFTTIVVVAACNRGDPSEAPALAPEPAPPSLAGTAKEFGLLVTYVHVERTRIGVDVGFEVENQGRAIVSVQAIRREKASEVALHAEVFRDGKWEPVPAADSSMLPLEEIWPGGTRYGRAAFPLDCPWGRVRVRASGLVGAKDGAIVPGEMDVFSDAFELMGSK